jgi:Acetoacetate decarboxylase (ADC)
MLQGTADVEGIAAGAPYVAALASEPLTVPQADLLQVAWEVAAADRDALLPPALHPVNPPVVTFSFVGARDSPYGPFTLAEARLLCRSGLRTRGFLIGAFVDNEEIATVLAGGWGYRLRPATVSLSRRYDGTSGAVLVDGAEVLSTGHVSPVPLSPSDLQYTATMHPARLDRGLRLVQVERDFQFTRAERGKPYVHTFDAGAWGEPRLRLSHPVSAASAAADVTYKPVRFVCRPDVWAFDGTEPVSH